jgi:5-methylcytosine-specific restriction endonuclease McrA
MFLAGLLVGYVVLLSVGCWCEPPRRKIFYFSGAKTLTKNCKNCGKEFGGRQMWTAAYCSERCRQAWKQRKWRRKMKEVKNSPLLKQFLEQERARQIKYKGLYTATNSERYRRWAEKYPEKATHNRARQQNRRKLLTTTLTVEEWQSALEFFDNKCAYCGIVLNEVHRDHFIPAKLGGGFTSSNIVPACPSCNKHKSARHPLDWLVMQKNGLVAYWRALFFLYHLS